ncbi:MAG: cysteine--tRNA ligase, partial [Candidatus Eisenbacteria bacterium]|nr:cysteine--tRNA ligase [Candidatus Eisenbacteria bacterium]
KMSKSLGNFYTLRDLIGDGFDPIAVRYLLISAHYRAQMNFTKENLKGAWESVVRIRNFARRLEEAAGKNGGDGAGAEASAADGASTVNEQSEAFLASFTAAVDDDLNMSQALAAVHDYMREINKLDPAGAGARAALASLRHADEILGLLESEPAKSEGDAEIDTLVAERQAARKNRDFARADEIRDRLAAEGIIIEDTKDGARWYRK